jgi:hypothetical protein
MPPTRPRGRQLDVLLALIAAGGDMPYRTLAEQFMKPTRDMCLRRGWIITRHGGSDTVRITSLGRLAAQAVSPAGYADAKAAAADPAARRNAAAHVGEQLAAFDVEVFQRG